MIQELGTEAVRHRQTPRNMLRQMFLRTARKIAKERVGGGESC